ncbi:calcium-binding protein [Salinilacihabitans rarus]|uniref:calcium-binding protein n=1 Tax=Salinilacihabitans rarus TaxID=2961596 RepID=UPI0020C8E4DA|nr:calcium-binding protein [Salinilacihabitans rarus]
MTDETYDNEPVDDSKGSLAKKGAVAGAAGLAALGASGSAAAQDGDEVLVFSSNYFPGADFEIIAELDRTTTDNVLVVDDEEVDEISDPTDWNGYVLRYDMNDSAGVTTFLFTEESLDEGDTGSLGEDTQMFSADLNLLSSDLD